MEPIAPLQKRRKPKLLIIGHARHGKDTLAEKIRDKIGLKFTSSSVFVGQEIIWPSWGRFKYGSFDEMFADRVNCRGLWADMISSYNTPDKTRTARTMLARGYDMYVGMRRRDEFEACREAKLFDCVIWVDALDRLSPEGKNSQELGPFHADYCCNNNGSPEAMDFFVTGLQMHLSHAGYDVSGEKA